MNTFGKHFRITTFGESHGRAIGVVIDGCPPRIRLQASDIQPFLDRRRPGQDALSSPRKEEDRVEILSGIFEGKTTGAPIAMIVWNRDARPEDYEELRSVFRPGHADYTFQKKYGIRDPRGGGRSSGRETVARVAAAALAIQCLSLYGIHIHSRICAIHGEEGPERMREVIRTVQDQGDSVGGIIELVASGCPAGLGDPVFGKLDAQIASAMMGIGGIKGVEIGEGFRAARMLGSEHNDPMLPGGFASNHAGGILGGISTGQDLVVRIAVKPTSSISRSQQTINSSGEPVEISVRGRHDPCIVPRVQPVAEAMLALVLIDTLLEQQKYKGFEEGMQD
jgi:chorismate synthase